MDAHFLNTHFVQILRGLINRVSKSNAEGIMIIILTVDFSLWLLRHGYFLLLDSNKMNLTGTNVIKIQT
jgi:hypothetical protein